MTLWLLAMFAQEGWGGSQSSDSEETEEPDAEPPAEPEPPTEPEPPAEPEPDIPFDPEQAVQAPELSRNQLEWLRPQVQKLPNNPYAHTDFTAYTLEWGEVKVGLSNVQVGVLPRTQLGTNVPLDALGFYNLNAKVNLIRLGPWDLGLTGSRTMFRQPDFALNYTGGGLVSSLQLTRKWSFHAGATYSALGMDGLPDPQAIHPLVPVSDDTLALVLDPVSYVGETLTVRLATDLRLNRRDSFILQAGAMVWNDTDGDAAELVMPILGIDEMVASQGWRPPNEVYSASVAYQADFKRLSVRFGVGTSTLPLAWTLSTFELSYRFGGAVKRDERVQRKTWRENRKDVTR